MQFKVITVTMLLCLSIASACTTPKPPPSLNLQYTPATQGPKNNNFTVAIINPVVTVTPPNDNSDKEPGPADTIPYIYTSDYAPRLQKAILFDLEKILKAKGLIVNQSFDSIDQVMPEDKRKIVLLVALTFDGSPQVTNVQNIYRYPTGTTHITNTGTIQLTGTVSVEFIEPRSMNKIMTKTFDINSLSLHDSVEYEDQADAQEKCIELLNEVYPVLMRKVEKEINVGILVKELNNIKNLNDNSR